MNVAGVTHLEFDLDGGTCLKLLDKLGLVQTHIFGEEELENFLAPNDIQKVICVDFNPKKPILGPEVEVYAHHHVEGAEHQGKIETKKTALEILIESIGKCGLDEKRLETWLKIVRMGDKTGGGDPMGIGLMLKMGHYHLNSEALTYETWFSPVFDSFFTKEPDMARAVTILREEIRKFLTGNPDTPAKFFFERWTKRAENSESFKSSITNFVNFLAYMESETARKWMQVILQGTHDWQVDFTDAKRQLPKLKTVFYGNTVIITAITTSRQLKPAIGSKVKSIVSSQNKSVDNDLDLIIKEKVKDRNCPWLLLLVNPVNKNFQIFLNGEKKVVHEIFDELTKAIRADILLSRNLPIDPSSLAAEGQIMGTAPLFFNRDVNFPNLLWGSLKYPEEKVPVEFGKTASEIHRRLNEVIKLALDENEFQQPCTPPDCQNCSIYLWQLKKCASKRL
ncbi:MAG: hypothetical protein Q8P45_03730 [Candidatus Harrisonbacteria bacterium]|nr:hypothetical protein [Candidatus Harrisonbacteria bacterium]